MKKAVTSYVNALARLKSLYLLISAVSVNPETPLVSLVMQVCIERKKMSKRNYWLKISKVKMKVVP